jgi:hypothetical protein
MGSQDSNISGNGFNIKRSTPKNTLQLGDDDIDFDLGSIDLKKETDNVSGISDRSDSIMFTRNSKNDSRKRTPDSKVRVSRSNEQAQRDGPSVVDRMMSRKPRVEPNSVDLGLDLLTNQRKKNIPEEIGDDRRGENIDIDLVNDIMDGDRSEDSRGSDRSHRSHRSNRSNRSAGGASASDVSMHSNHRSKYISEDERKQELLLLFDRLEKKGVRLEKRFNMRSPLEEMERVYERIKHEREVQASIKFQRRVLMGIISTLEFCNTRFNPFDLELEGWTESVMENCSEYDDIFEELHEKYKHRGNISPEVRLLMTLVGSAFMFHLTKSMLKPAQEKMAQMFGGGGAEGGAGMPNLGSLFGGGGAGGLGGLMSGLMGGGGSGGFGGMMGGGMGQPPMNPSGGGMRGPQGFDDVLSNDGRRTPSVLSDIPSIDSQPARAGGRPSMGDMRNARVLPPTNQRGGSKKNVLNMM